MLGAQAAVNALDTAIKKGGPEAAVDVAVNAVLDRICETSAKAGPASAKGAAADLTTGLLADRTTGLFNTSGFMRHVRSVRTGGYLSCRGAFESPASAAARKKRLKSCGRITYSGRSYNTPGYRPFGSGKAKKKKAKKKKKKKKTKKKKKAKGRRRSSYMSYDLFA